MNEAHGRRILSAGGLTTSHAGYSMMSTAAAAVAATAVWSDFAFVFP